MTRPCLRAAVPLCLALVAACSKKDGVPQASQAATPANRAGGQRPSSPVEVVVAREQRVTDAITGTGQIEPVQSIELRPEVEGRITEILFNEGSRIVQGQELFKVDDAELRVQVVRAEADRDLARQALARQRQLTESQSATTSDLEQAEATARSTQASLDLLRLRLERTTVRAPFSGVAGARTVSLGDYVNNQSRLVTLQTINPQRAALAVPERYAEQLRLGRPVTFRVAALRDREFTGIVDFVDPVVRVPARTILVKARVPNPAGVLQAGMFIEGELIAAVREHAVVVPEDAPISLQGSTQIWVVKDGKVSRKEVTLGIRMPGYVEVTGGLTAGDTVVVGGQERLAEGASVRTTVVERRP